MKCLQCLETMKIDVDHVPLIVTPDGGMVCSDRCKRRYEIKLNWNIRNLNRKTL